MNRSVFRVKKVYLIIVLSFLIVSWNSIQEDSFVFQKEGQKLELKIENGVNYIKWDTATKITIKTKKINQKKMMVAAPGLKMLKAGSETKESIWEITVVKTPSKKDTLTISFTGRDLKDLVWSHQFKILIK